MASNKVKFKTTEKNPYRYKAFRKELTKANKTTLDFGFFEEDKYPDGTQVAAVAAYNEFGTDNAPQRSFIRSVIDANRLKYLKLEEKLVAKIGKQSLSKLYDKLGEEIKKDVEAALVNFSSPGNADSTVEAKGEDNPLEDTGLLKDSLKFKVKKGIL